MLGGGIFDWDLEASRKTQSIELLQSDFLYRSYFIALQRNGILGIPSMFSLVVNQNEMEGYQVAGFLADTLKIFYFHSFPVWSRGHY